MFKNKYSTCVHSMKIQWLQTPPFLNNYGIVITLSNDGSCPNKCANTPPTCVVYDENGDKIKELSNPVTSDLLIDSILKFYFPQKNNKPDFDSHHVNLMVFRGDFMIPTNYEFITDMFNIMQKLHIGMKIATETMGSDNKEELPALLSEGIIDSVIINLGVYTTWDTNVAEYTERALNSLTQCINAKIEDDLEYIGISFLFDQYSTIDVFIEYLRILFDAYRDDESEGKGISAKEIFEYFEVYLRGDGTECKGIINEAYHNGIEIFIEDKIKKVPINKEKNSLRCIFCHT